MHLFIVLHLYCIDTVDARDKRIRVLFEMSVELGQDFLYQFELLLRYGLHNKASIMTEKEETSARARCLSGIKDLVAISKRIQRPLNLLETNIIHCSQALKDARRESFNFGSWQSVSTIFFTRRSHIGGRLLLR